MSKVVCGSQMPLPFVFLVFVNYKAEILAMIVFVFGNIIEHHSTTAEFGSYLLGNLVWIVV